MRAETAQTLLVGCHHYRRIQWMSSWSENLRTTAMSTCPLWAHAVAGRQIPIHTYCLKWNVWSVQKCTPTLEYRSVYTCTVSSVLRRGAKTNYLEKNWVVHYVGNSSLSLCRSTSSLTTFCRRKRRRVLRVRQVLMRFVVMTRKVNHRLECGFSLLCWASDEAFSYLWARVQCNQVDTFIWYVV